MRDQSALMNDLQRENAALRESEARYRAVLETISDFAYIVQVLPDGTRQPEWVMPVTSTITGYDPTMMLQPDFWRQITHPDDWPIVQAQIDELLANRSANVEYRILSANGEVHWVLDHAQPEWDPRQQRVIRIYGALQDITKRKQAEQEHQVYVYLLENLERIDQAIKAETDVEQMLWGVIKMVQSVFDCDRAWLVYPCDPDAPSFRVPIEFSRPEYPGALALNLEVPMVPSMAQEMRNALASVSPVAYTNGTDRSVSPEVTEQFGVQAQLEMAIYPKTGRPWVFGLHQCSYRRHWTEPEQSLFNEIGHRLADGLSSALYLREVKDSEERYRSLFDNMTEGFALHELVFDEAGQPYDYRFLSVNHAFEQLTGLKRENLIGQLQGQVLPNEDPYWLKTYCQVALTGEPVHLEHRSPVLQRDYEVFAYRPAPNQFAVIFSDTTQRKRAERQLRLQGAALEAAANSIIITDRTGAIEWANPAFTTLTGYTLDEISGRNPRDLIRSGQQSREFYRILWDTILSGQVWNGEIVNRHKDGRLYVEEITITPVRTAGDDQITHFVAVKQDITARKQVDLALRQYAERLQTLHEIDRGVAVAQSPRETALIALRHLRRLVPSDRMSVMLFDRNTRQPRMLAAFTDQPDEQLTDSQFDIPPAALEPFGRNEVVLINDAAADTRPDTSLISRGLHADGIRAYMTAPLIVEDELIGLLNVGSAKPHIYDQDHLDIIRELSLQLAIAIHQARLREQIQQHAAELEARVTQRTGQLAEANAELAEANERLQELDSLKSKFVSEVSHELRTPVTSLVLFLDLLEHGKPEKHAHYLSSATQQALRMKQLIEDILDLSRLERDKADLTPGPIDLNAVLEQAMMAQLPRAAAAQLNVAIDLAPDLPAVRGDINRVLQVATNLISNAINYTSKGEVRIRSFWQPDRARVGFEVQDTGMGIAPEDLPHLFKRFYRGQRASQSSVRGTGLGLNIAKEIVDWLGGEIEVRSEVGVGSTFTVWLPLA